MTAVDTRPYYEVSAQTLASWLQDNAPDASWSVDGDDLLTSLLDFPCPTEELADELRRIDREMLVHAPADENAMGQQLGEEDLGRLVMSESSTPDGKGMPSRMLYLRWKGQDSSTEWVLFEDIA